MNFSGKFDAGSLGAATPLPDAAHHGQTFELAPNHLNTQHAIVVPDAQLLFAGDFKRAGNDLILSHEDRSFKVTDYFRNDKHGTLASPEGATLSAAVVDAMTGYVTYAQASPTAANDKPIGHVVKLSGTATVIRNGVAVELNVGDNVFKNDVVQAGSNSSIGITFIDGSAFGLQSNARMVLNEMIYDPNGSSNSALMSVVQGTVTFVAGQAAKNGGMKIDTPVATMGIRGTAGVLEVVADFGPTKITLVVEPGGHTGALEVVDKATGAVIATITQAGVVNFIAPNVSGLPTFTERQQTLDEQRYEREVIQQVFQLYFPQYNEDAKPGSKPGQGSSTNALAGSGGTGGTGNLQTGAPGTVTITKTNADGTTTTTTTQIQVFPNTPPIITTTDTSGVQADGIPNLEVTQSGTRGDKNFKIADFVKIVDPDIGGVLQDQPQPYVADSGFISKAEGPPSLPPGFNLLDLVHLDKATGVVTYDPSNFKFLGAHEKAVFTFEFVSGSGPDFLAEKMTLTVVGLDDAPTFDTPDTALGLTETAGATRSDALISKVAVLPFHDADFSDVASGYTVETLGVATSGHTALLPDEATLLSFFHFNSITKDIGTDHGTITETFSAPDQTFDYLADGETVTITYTVQVTDAEGASNTQTVTFTITGSNDVPTITSATTAAQVSGGVVEDGTQTAAGTITFSDVDLTDTHTLSQALTSGSISSALPGFNPATQPLGTLSLVKHENNADLSDIGTVDWQFTINNALAQQLGAGQVVTQVYTVTIYDGHLGGTVTQDITVAITGSNDDPTIVVAQTTATGGVLEDTNIGANHSLSTSGTITFNDIDLTDTHVIPVNPLSPVSVSVTDGHGHSEPLPGFNPATDHLGTLQLTLVENPADQNTHGTIQWVFTVDNNNSYVQALAIGQTITQVYDVSIDDGHGGTITQQITVTIAGTNDDPLDSGPTIVGNQTDAIAAVIEDTNIVADNPTTVAVETGHFLTDHGTITFQDVDLIDSHTLPTVPLLPATVTVTDSAGHAQPLPGFNPASQSLGTFTFVLNENTSDTNNLATIDWTFAVNNDDPYVQALAAGQTITQIYNVRIDDGHGGVVTQPVTVTIAGTNDAPTIVSSTNDTPGLTEDSVALEADLLASGVVTFADVDLIDTHTASFVLKSSTSSAVLPGFNDGDALGSFILTSGASGVSENNGDTNTNGTVGWSYTLADNNAVLQSLAEGQTLTLVYTITVLDNNGLSKS